MKKASTPFLLVAFALALAAACTPDDDSKPAGTPTTPTGGSTDAPITLGRPSVHPGADYLVLARDTSLLIEQLADSLYFSLTARPTSGNTLAYVRLNAVGSPAKTQEEIARYPEQGTLQGQQALGISTTFTTESPTQPGTYTYTITAVESSGSSQQTSITLTLGKTTVDCGAKDIVADIVHKGDTIRLLNVSGGVPPYQYRFFFTESDNTTFGDKAYYKNQNLREGTLTVVIKDSEACTDTLRTTFTLLGDEFSFEIGAEHLNLLPIGLGFPTTSFAGFYDIDTRQSYSVNEYEANKGSIDFALLSGEYLLTNVDISSSSSYIASPDAVLTNDAYKSKPINTVGAQAVRFTETPGVNYERVRTLEELRGLYEVTCTPTTGCAFFVKKDIAPMPGYTGEENGAVIFKIGEKFGIMHHVDATLPRDHEFRIKVKYQN